MHHSHAALTVTSLPSASYLMGLRSRNFETPPLRPNGRPSPASVVPAGGSGETRWRSGRGPTPLRHDECWGGAPPDGRDHSRSPAAPSVLPTTRTSSSSPTASRRRWQRRAVPGQGRRCQWRADGPAAWRRACSTRSASSWCQSCWAGTPLFAELGATPVQFEGPVAVVEGAGVTHLRYRVQK